MSGLMVDRDLLALFARPAMRSNPASWLVWFSFDGYRVPRHVSECGALVASYKVATVGFGPAWCDPDRCAVCGFKPYCVCGGV